MDDCIGDSSFIFKADKNKPFSGSGALARDDAAANAKILSVRHVSEIASLANAARRHFGTMVSHGMRPNRQTSSAKISDQTLFVIHGTQRRLGIGLGQLV